MPNVSGPYLQDFYNPNLIAWYDASKSNNIIPRIPPGQDTVSLSNILDSGTQSNSLSVNGSIIYANFSNGDPFLNIVTYSNFFWIFDQQYAQNTDITLKYRPTGITVFLVLAPGYSALGNNIISIFGTSYLSSNLSAIPPYYLSNYGTTPNTALVGIDWNNYAYATNSSNIGARSLQLNSNTMRIISATFDSSNVILRVNGSSTTSACALSFVNGSGPYTIQLGDSNFIGPLLAGLNDTRTPSGTGFSLPYLEEVRVYSYAMPTVMLSNIESQLANKWSVKYPISSNLNPVLGVDNLLLWLDPTNTNNLTFDGGGSEGLNVKFFSSSEQLNNTATYYLGEPVWNNNLINYGNAITGRNAGLTNTLFQGTGIVQGLTISLALQSSPFNNSPFQTYKYGDLLNLFTPSNLSDLGNINYPCLLNDLSGNVLVGNQAHGRYTLGLPIGIGIDSTDTCVLTAQIDGNNNYQLFINGWPMLTQNLNTPFNLPLIVDITANNFIGGSPDFGDPYNTIIGSSAEIGELIVYKKILSSSELNTVHNHIFSNYNITSNINTSGLIGWFDATTTFGYCNTAYTTSNWVSRYGSITDISCNDISGTIVRSWSNPFNNTFFNGVDFNNGVPTIMSRSNLNIDTSGCISIFLVCTNNGVIGVSGELIDISGDISNNFISVTNNYSFIMDSNAINTVSVLPSPFYIVHFESYIGTSQNIYAIPYGGRNEAFTGIIQNIYAFSLGGNINTNTFGMNTIFEALVYNRAMSNNEAANIYGYLQSKYSFPYYYYPTPDTVGGLILWYDPNDLNGRGDNLFPSYCNSYGPTLSNINISPNISLINGNYYATINTDSDVYYVLSGLDLTLYADSYGYTLFMITNSIGSGSFFSIYNDVDDPIYTVQPNVFYSSSNINIGCGSNREVVQTSRSLVTGKNLFAENYTLLTCVTHYSSSGRTSIQTKGTYGEIVNNTSNTMNFSGYSNTIVLGGGSLNNTNIINRISSGNIGEVLLYARDLNDNEKLNIFNYLERKWINGNGP